MEFQDFIQRMPDDLLSDKGKRLKQTLNDWFPDESETILNAMKESEKESSRKYTRHQPDKDTETPVWTKK